MDLQDTGWIKAAEKLTTQFGPVFQAKILNDNLKKIQSLLQKMFPELSKGVISQALTQTATKLADGAGWARFLCQLRAAIPGSWGTIANKPGFGASNMLLLTDGSVMCQQQGGAQWKKLTPDSHGSYVNGTWSNLAPMHWTRRYYASAVLKDGRVFISGGEYSNAGSETNRSEIYNPVTDTWIEIAPPPGWTRVGDAACAVLPDGRVLLGNLDDTRTAIYDPATNSWIAGPVKGSRSAEESWVLLPDNTVITVRCDNSRIADKYVMASNSWVSGGMLPANIVEVSSSEIGAGILLEDGRAFFAGANNNTALYTRPMLPNNPGTWSMGPTFPNDGNNRMLGCKDTPACLMTNGRVLIAAGPVDGLRDSFLGPTSFFEFDGSSLNRVADPVNATNVPYIGRMLLLPTGQILFAAQTDDIAIYSYFGCINPAAQPHITACPAIIRPLNSYTLSGRLLNGLSQAVGYGDDASAATNYPLVRIRHLTSNTITYCRTFDHSSMGVATGNTIHSTNFSVPPGIPLGASEIVVIANGIASPALPIDVQSRHVQINIFHDALYVELIGSLADGPLWAWGPNGPVPVDPQAPNAAAIKEARKAIIGGLNLLKKLGGTLDGIRQEEAAALPLAPDDDTEEDEDEDKNEK
jgi:hypothetical protein